MVNIVNPVNLEMVLFKSFGGHECPESEFKAVSDHFQTAYLLMIKAIRSKCSTAVCIIIIYINRTHMCTNKTPLLV